MITLQTVWVHMFVCIEQVREMKDYFKKIISTTVFLFFLSMSTPSFAIHFCKGNIQDVWVDFAGSLFIKGSWVNKHTKICNVTSGWEAISPEVCKTWLSLSMTAQVSQPDVTVRYKDDKISNCQNIPTYGNSPSPDYVMLDGTP